MMRRRKGEDNQTHRQRQRRERERAEERRRKQGRLPAWILLLHSVESIKERMKKWYMSKDYI